MDGFYIGGNGGAGFGTTETNANLGPAITTITGTPVAFNLPISSQTFNGFLAGGQVGYNWQAGFVVLGLEGDFDWANMKGSTPCVVVFACTVSHDWIADITARVGVVAFDKALVFIKGGVAWEESKYALGNSISIGGIGTFAANASASSTQVGGLLAMGIEYAFLPNWSAKIEYNFIDFGSHTVNFPITTTPAIGGVIGATLAAGVPVSINEFQHIVKAGVNYRF